MKKIVIGVITFNQQDVIGRALDSLLSQKNWGLYRVVVSDDCSQDGTWDILKNYKSRYPDILDIYHNNRRLGIYGNIQKLDMRLPVGDLYGSLSGDDKYCDGYFEGVQKLIEEQNVNTEDLIGIYSDWQCISFNGHTGIYKQDIIPSCSCSLLSLKLRGLIYNRSLLISKGVHDSISPISLDKGLAFSEWAYDIQPHALIKRAYYLPRVTSVYFSNIGVSKELSDLHSSYSTDQQIDVWNYLISRYITDPRDIHYANYRLTRARFVIKPSISKLFLMIYHYMAGSIPGTKQSLCLALRLFLSYVKYLFVSYFSWNKQ